MKRKFIAMFAVAASLSALCGASAQGDAKERVAAIKQNLEVSKALLKPYEWIETTVVSVKGEEKSRKMNKCYHGADGKVQKVPIDTGAPPPKEKRGLRGKIAEKKKAELTGYMKDAVELVKSYLPPDPLLIQSAQQSGRVSVNLLEPGKRVRVDFRDYRKKGDVLGLELDLVNNRVLGANVSTYLATAKDAVSMIARFSTLENTATYLADVTLDAPAKNLRINVFNSGYRSHGG